MGEGFWQGAAVITGAGSGLGATMADRFAAEGMAIVSLDIDGATAEQTAQRVRDAGGRAIAMRVDVSDGASLDAAAERARAEFGSVNVLAANVGVQQFGAAERLTEIDWRWVMDVNVIGVARTVNAFLPLLRQASGNRRIVVTASSAVLDPGVRLAAYSASKFAVMGYGETLRQELAEEGIGVSVLFPASMSTRHMESSKAARPREFGESVIMPDDIDALVKSRAINPALAIVTAEHATRNLLADLEANRRYIATHGAYVDALKARCEDLIDALVRAQD